ncbi:MAG: hypothetical protein AMK71_09445 [Nitrospira bacterium SG8_35_4]|nr:MAG: hypothetical protein AMK71_09445 [Nitrospira bacterium SG8_35_4]
MVNLEGLIPLLGGLYALLLARGILSASKDVSRNEAWRRKWGPKLKWLAPLVMLFGLVQLIGLI